MVRGASVTIAIGATIIGVITTAITASIDESKAFSSEACPRTEPRLRAR
jgi:hypothetical protein